MQYECKKVTKSSVCIILNSQLETFKLEESDFQNLGEHVGNFPVIFRSYELLRELKSPLSSHKFPRDWLHSVRVCWWKYPN